MLCTFNALWGSNWHLYTLCLTATDGYRPDDLLFDIARVVLALKTMEISHKLPNGYACKKTVSLLVLLFFVSFVSCTVTFIVSASFTEFDIHSSWAIAAASTLSDPVFIAQYCTDTFLMTMFPKEQKIAYSIWKCHKRDVCAILLHMLLDVFMRSPRRYVGYFMEKTLSSGLYARFCGVFYEKAFALRAKTITL
eukprot:jgi/Antlo1/1124/827